MALSTLAQWTGSTLISKLVDMAYSYMGEHMLPENIEAYLTRLNTALPKITAVIGVAEALKFKHPNSWVSAWLEQFRLAVQAAEDVLDELKYRELEAIVKDHDQDQVSGSFSSSTFGSLKRKLSQYSGSTVNDGTLKRLRKAVEMLDMAVADVGPFLELASTLGFRGPLEPHGEISETSSRETSSFLTESEVLGRETEKSKIMEWLRKPASQAQISVFCIIGVGGLGKTTLAQLIFRDMQRENHFDRTIWVCVSTSFSVEDITRKLLEELGQVARFDESLNDLQNKLKESIESLKVLFILDDVWNDENMCDWEKLMAPLKAVQEGSKILLTTRMKSVAGMLAHVLNVEQEDLMLEGLEEQPLLLLLNKYAFYGFNPDDHKDLQMLGSEIVKMLRGSPLLAKVIGSLLNSCIDFDYWERILNCDSLINLEQAKDMIDVLKLSYYHLPSDLQKCFRFCCIFPQDHLFKKSELIRMWMASEFIRQESCSKGRPEDIGEEYFNYLLRKSFLEHSWNQDGYVMHDLIHDLAQNVSNGECCRVEPNDKLVTIPSTVQHVFVHESEIERIFHLKNLRTLVIIMSWSTFSDYSDQFVLPNRLLKETLRVLTIYGYRNCEIPEEIGCLIHLRYLSIESTTLFAVTITNSLPLSTYKLYHLQVLELIVKYGITDCSRIQTTGITNLVSLRYMNLPREIIQNIHGVRKLTSLQELTLIVGQENGYHIDEVKMLNSLQHLSIEQMENVRDAAEAKNANLFEKEYLFSLSLNWSYGSDSDNPEQIIDNLQPYPSIRELTIEHYKGRRSPIWMRDVPPQNLSSLDICGCVLWEDLPLLGKMPHLKKLSLADMNEVKQLDYSFDRKSCVCAFPSLEELFCRGMPKWESWAGSLSCYGFPNLKELDITDCPNLAKLPAIPLSLSKFVVHRVGLNSLPDIYHSSSISTPAAASLKSSLRVVEIISCPNLESLNGFLQQENLDLNAIEELKIHHCKNLVQLPMGAFRKFGSLKDLSVVENPKLVAVDNHSILPVKVRSLSIGNCGELDALLLESASCLTTLATLSIGNSENITHIPSSENAFASLSSLHIQKCNKLVKLSYMEQVHDVNPGNNSASLKIRFLSIDHHSLLLIEPLRSLRFLTECYIVGCPGMEALPEQWLLQNSSTLKTLFIRDASTLRSLPGTMVRLTTLQQLTIERAPLLEELPELPPSLNNKEIHGSGGRLL